MHFKLTTRVAKPPAAVFPAFGDPKFIETLAPPVMGLQVMNVGLRLGDEIHVRFRVMGPLGDWVSRIVQIQRNRDEIWFVDRSMEVPWPFSRFQHRHGFVRDGKGTLLVDDVDYDTSPTVLEFPMLPVLYASFAYRRPVYERRFGPR